MKRWLQPTLLSKKASCNIYIVLLHLCKNIVCIYREDKVVSDKIYAKLLMDHFYFILIVF